MSRRKIFAGSTSVTVPVFVQDNSATNGAGLAALVFNTANLAAKYRREGQASWTTVTLATAAVGTWVSGGFVADGGPVPGGYEVGIPNAVLAAGAKWAEVVIYGAANMLPVLLEFELDTIDYQATGGAVPVSGDFTAAMKTSLNAASVNVGSVGGTVLGDSTGGNFETFFGNGGATSSLLVESVSSLDTSNIPTAAANAAAVWSAAGRTLSSFSFTVTAGTVSDKTGYSLAAAGLDPVLIESAIAASAALVNDAGTQLTGINARQALAAILSAVAAQLAGAATTTVTTKPAAKPAANDRITATVTADGDRTAVNLRLPT